MERSTPPIDFVAAKLDGVIKSRIEDVSIEGKAGILTSLCRCGSVLVTWEADKDEDGNRSPMSGYDLDEVTSDLTDATWESKDCYQARIDDFGECGEASPATFTVDGNDLSDEYDLANISINHTGDSKSEYQSSGAAAWYEIKVVFESGDEVSVSDGEDLDEWLKENGYKNGLS